MKTLQQEAVLIGTVRYPDSPSGRSRRIRDTDASFDPQIVKKRQRRLTGVDQIVSSLTARGLTT